jgi:hypothetical protein
MRVWLGTQAVILKVRIAAISFRASYFKDKLTN